MGKSYDFFCFTNFFFGNSLLTTYEFFAELFHMLLIFWAVNVVCYNVHDGASLSRLTSDFFHCSCTKVGYSDKTQHFDKVTTLARFYYFR